MISNNQEKILVFHQALAPYRVDLFNAISITYNTVFYFNYANVLDQSFDQVFLKRQCNFKINILNEGFELFGRAFRFGIVKILKNNNPDIVLCSEYGSLTIFVLLYKKIFKKKYRLYTICDDSVDMIKKRKRFGLILRKIVAKNINGIIFNSKAVCDWHKQNIDNKSKIIEIPIIHNCERFRNDLKNSIQKANTSINQYKLHGKKILLYVGRFAKVKNLLLLIDAVSKLESSDWILIMVGDGEEMNHLKIEANKKKITDKVIFTGRKEGIELLSWYTIAHLFILPSIHEPFGAVVNEALLGGCKVLCSEIAGSASLINNENGLLFNPYNETDLYKCLEKSLKLIVPIISNITELRSSNMPFSFFSKINCLKDNL